MKFGQLIEYSMRNIFLEISYTKCDGETIPKPFSKKSKLRICNNVTYEHIFPFHIFVTITSRKSTEVLLHLVAPLYSAVLCFNSEQINVF